MHVHRRRKTSTKIEEKRKRSVGKKIELARCREGGIPCSDSIDALTCMVIQSP
jgi:hypothetical protein